MPKTRKIQIAYFIYWVLLAYIIAAIVFWFITLNQQNEQMAAFKIEKLRPEDKGYQKELIKIEEARAVKVAQYLGEGSMFLVLILAGAIYVFRSVRKQLKQSQEQQNFMVAITHELKTPIAVTKLNLETLQKRKLDESQQKKLLKNTLHEANRLDNLCNNLLYSSQLEGKVYDFVFENINWSDTIRSSVQDYKQRNADQKIIAEIDEEYYARGDAFLLQVVSSNLIDNAIKYSPTEAPIKVSLQALGETIILSVSDEGKGIPVEERKRIFKKFYRLGNSATRKAKGTGLGLYLCHKIITEHKGKIAVEENDKGGSTFTVSLKREKQPKA